ncbi:MAG: mechanosensitive ion channel family protein [Opitutales bacterium]|nr:mechanosensitive ion channel family protein [Opitutales bacterium]
MNSLPLFFAETSANWSHFGRAALLLVFGGIFLWFLSGGTKALLTRHVSLHIGLVMRKLILYIGAFLLLVAFLLQLGFDLTGVLATAGIATVAIGFAAQTSLSNLISGLFLIGEKPFQIGDLVRVGGTLGVVDSIDLLSIKLRTLDNLFVRIPNEEMIKSQVTTVTRYPIRRMDFDLKFAVREEPEQIEQVLREVAHRNPLVMVDPEPLILFNNIQDRALEYRFGVWFEKTNFLKVRNSLLKDLKKALDEARIELPYAKMAIDRESLMEKPPVPEAADPDEEEE